MGVWANAVLTRQGLNYHAKVETGAPFKLTKALAGKGTVPVAELRNQTDVVDPVKDMKLANVFYSDENTASLPATLSSTGLTSGFELRQIGLYAEDPDDGEILYILAQATVGDTIPSENEAPLFTLEMDFRVVFGTDLAVTVTIDPSLGVSHGELEHTIAELQDWVQKRYIPIPEKGAPGGVATLNLDEDSEAGVGQVPERQLRKATGEDFGIVRLTREWSFVEDPLSFDVWGRFKDIMNMEIFKETGLFTAKKTGKYKVIAVGGGGSASFGNVGATDGGNTTFGSFLTATGGIYGQTRWHLTPNTDLTAQTRSYTTQIPPVPGFGVKGYMLGVETRGNEFDGYGAGGRVVSENSILLYFNGNCGQWNLGIFNLTKGDIVPVVVGAGGYYSGNTPYKSGRDGICLVFWDD